MTAPLGFVACGIKPLERKDRMQNIKFIVERHSDGYVAYPLGVNGVVVGEGETDDEALADAQSALRFHIATFGSCDSEE